MDDTTLKTVVISIDPGATGSMCILNIETLEIEFVDFKNDGLLGYIKKLKEIQSDKSMFIKAFTVEFVRSMPGQGVSSVFSFGQRLGELIGMLQTLEIGYEETRPLTWQKVCGVVAKSGKSGTFEAIRKIYPKANITGPKGGIMDGRCDALGLAHYLRKTY